MSRQFSIRKRNVVRTLAVTAILAFVPLTFSFAGGLESNNVEYSAAEGCCRNPDGICKFSGEEVNVPYVVRARGVKP
ncbi:hypothetical protein BH23GEM3_BH23GEM3_09360 [soil metagenome]